MNMKIKNASLMVAGTFASAIAIPAYADVDLPQVYGRADISINSTEEAGADSSIQTNSNASRIGFQNTHALNDALSVFYRLEYEVNFDERLRSSDKGMLRQRNSVVGLQGGWGKFFVGVHDTPMKKAELKVDLFSDVHRADIDEVLRGQDRTSDTISYITPKFGNVEAWVMLIPGDDASGTPGTDSVAGSSDAVSGDGIADAVSASVSYSTKPLQLALAYNSELNGRDIIRASGQVQVGPASLGAIVQKTEKSVGTSQDGIAFVLSAALNISPNDKLKLQFTSADDESEEGVPGGEMLSFGIDHSLAKSTKLYAYYSDLSVDNDPSAEFSTIGVGLRHDFGVSK